MTSCAPAGACDGWLSPETQESRIAPMIARHVTVIHGLSEEPGPVRYWMTRTPRERIAELEDLRRQYHVWKYGHAEPGFQRVYRVVGQARG